MEIRAIEGEAVRVPCGEGESVYLAVQNQHHSLVGTGGEVRIDLSRLYFGNRRELEGEVWRGKRKIRLVVERRHGN